MGQKQKNAFHKDNESDKQTKTMKNGEFEKH